MDKNKLNIAQNAIKEIAKRDGVSVDYVRKQMKIAMLNGLCSKDPQVKRFWDSVPRESEILTPEELIIYITEIVKHGKAT